MKRFGDKGWTPERLDSLEGKTYVITGTTTGTGYEAAKIFLSKGAKVVMLNRNGNTSESRIIEFKKEFGEKVDVSFIHMDLFVQSSVRNAASEVLEKVDRIDGLICNAAIAQLATRELTIDGYEGHFGANHYGHFLLSGLLFDTIEESNGRIVIVGSLAYKQGMKRIKFEDLNLDKNYTPWDAYAQSKLAQMMTGFELQRRIKASGRNVEVQVCHPGASHTDLIKGENVSKRVKVFWALTAPLIAQSAKKGAYPEVMCATEKDLGSSVIFGPTKKMEMGGAVDEGTTEKLVLDEEAAKKLWDLSVKNTGLKWMI